MAKKINAFFDDSGNMHDNARAATTNDISVLLGHDGTSEGESLAPGIANFIFDHREELEKIFAQHDRMVTALRQVQEGAEGENVTALTPRAAAS